MLNWFFFANCRCMEANDFFEGVRCTLIDKNDTPKFQHASVRDVKQSEINKYFETLPKELELSLWVCKRESERNLSYILFWNKKGNIRDFYLNGFIKLYAIYGDWKRI